MSSLCSICSRKVLSHSRLLCCASCKHYVHRHCLLLSQEEFAYYSQISDWYCTKCIEMVFPYNQITEDTDFSNALYEINLDYIAVPFERFKTRIFDPFELNESENRYLPYGDIDPDTMYFNNIKYQLQSSSNYYLEDSFNELINKNSINENCPGMLHNNICSIPANLTKFLAYLKNINFVFPVIGLTETKLSEQNKSLYDISGYTSYHLTKDVNDLVRGHGVSVYIRSIYESTIIDRYTICKEYLECIFIDVTFGINSYIIGVVYRPPNSNVNSFTEEFFNMVNSIKSKFKKPLYLMGDYNLDLLKYDENKYVCEFLDMFFSYGFIPLINRPTRVTEKTATIIDHIYTNNYDVESKLHQGILITDTSDHFAIFHILQDELNSANVEEPVLVRHVNDINLIRFQNDILNVNWTSVYECTNAQSAFTKFFEIHSSIFNRCFPIKPLKKTYRNRLPWLTNGLKLSIKTKNNLYKRHLKHPSAYNQNKYSRYRNSLTSLMKKN